MVLYTSNCKKQKLKNFFILYSLILLWTVKPSFDKLKRSNLEWVFATNRRDCKDDRKLLKCDDPEQIDSNAIDGNLKFVHS